MMVGLLGTLAGTGTCTPTGADGSAALSTNINYPAQLQLDSFGNLYFTETGTGYIRKITMSNGIISTLVTTIGVNQYGNMALDVCNNIYWASSINRVNRYNATTAAITAIAGVGTSYSYNSKTNYRGSTILLNFATRGQIAFGTSGNLYIAAYAGSTTASNFVLYSMYMPSTCTRRTSGPTPSPTALNTPVTSAPTGQPSMQPSRQPTKQPIMNPSTQPTRRPSQQPSMQPSSQPTRQPSRQPSSQPTRQPVMRPTGQPTRQPSSQPTRQPTKNPSRQPTGQPSRRPSMQPAGHPTSQPSLQPTARPSAKPTPAPLTPSPTIAGFTSGCTARGKYVNTTVNARYTSGNAGIPGSAQAAQIGTPTALAVYKSQFLYVADSNNRVLRVTLSTKLIRVYIKLGKT